MANYKFFQNSACEYFPCHQVNDSDNFNCLFCFCSLYALSDRCGGNFTYTKEGIKDCSACLVPHRRENYDKIMEKMGHVIESSKKQQETAE